MTSPTFLCLTMNTPLHRSLLSRESTCHLRSDSSFSTGNLQYPLVGQHLLSLRVRIPPFPQEAPPSAKTTINLRLLSLPICHSMQCTPRTPLTTPSPTTPTTPQRACYVTVGTFARRGLSSTAKTLRSLSGVRGSEY